MSAVLEESSGPRVSVTVSGRPRPDMPVGRSELADVARRTLSALGLDEAEVQIRLTGDAGMALLHERHLARVGPTNVLSFPADEDDPESVGLVVLSVDTLAREARFYGQDPLEHLVRLLAHAFLHLAGLPHGPEMEAFTEAAVDSVRDSLSEF